VSGGGEEGGAGRGPDRERRRGRLRTLGKAVVTAALVAFILTRISLGEALAILAGARPAALLAALGVFAVSVLAGAWQWGRFLAAMGIPLSVPKLLELYWVGLFFNNFLPSNVGGDLVKVLDLSRERYDPVAAATATLADRVTGLAALALLAALAARLLAPRAELAGLVAPVFWGALVFLVLLLLVLVGPLAGAAHRLARRLGLLPAGGTRARIVEQLRRLRRRRALFGGLFLFSLLVQALRVAVHYLAGLSLLGDACPLVFDFFLVVPPLAFALTLPVTLGGLGLREGLALPLFAPLGVGGEAAVAIEVLAYLLMLLVSLGGGLLFLLRRGRPRAAEKGVVPPGTFRQDLLSICRFCSLLPSFREVSMSGRRLAALLAGIASFLAPFWVYLRTLSPTLNFWDCGEFIAAGYTLGIPHPPATPLFVLLVRLASVLPLGVGVAQKANMMSALFGALASLMMFLLVLKLTRHWKWGVRPLPDWVRLAGALCGALFIAFSDTFWLNAIEAEVYALSAFFLGLVLWLVLDWSEHAAVKRGNALVYLILYLLSMGIGLHLGTILVFPGLFVMALMIRTKSFNDLELWLVGATLALFLGSAILHMPDAIMFTGLLAILAAGVAFQARGRPFLLASLGLFALGLSVHLFLLIRAGQSPVMNEADPSNWGNLWAVLKREQYPFQLPTDRKAPLGWQFQHFFGYFWSQFRMPPERQWGVLHLGRALTALPIGLGLLGLWHQFKQEKRHWAATVTVLLVNTIGLVFFLNFSSEEVRERDYFYAAGFYFYALFIGLGAVGLMQTLLEERRGRLLAAVAAPLLVLAAFGPLQHHWYTHDRSENLIARDYAINMLMPLE